MRAGTETALSRVNAVFSPAKPHFVYLFVNRHANRMKVVVDHGIDVRKQAPLIDQLNFIHPFIQCFTLFEITSQPRSLAKARVTGQQSAVG